MKTIERLKGNKIPVTWEPVGYTESVSELVGFATYPGGKEPEKAATALGIIEDGQLLNHWDVEFTDEFAFLVPWQLNEKLNPDYWRVKWNRKDDSLEFYDDDVVHCFDGKEYDIATAMGHEIRTNRYREGNVTMIEVFMDGKPLCEFRPHRKDLFTAANSGRLTYYGCFPFAE